MRRRRRQRLGGGQPPPATPALPDPPPRTAPAALPKWTGVCRATRRTGRRTRRMERAGPWQTSVRSQRPAGKRHNLHWWARLAGRAAREPVAGTARSYRKPTGPARAPTCLHSSPSRRYRIRNRGISLDTVISAAAAAAVTAAAT